jgi:hypothetical protein
MKRYNIVPSWSRQSDDIAGEYVLHSDHEAALAAAVHAAEVATWAKAGAEHNVALAAAVKKEREACALLCEKDAKYWADKGCLMEAGEAMHLANTIRAKGDDASLARRYEEIAQAALDARKEGK